MRPYSNLGRVPYQQALEIQERMVELRARDEVPDTILLVEHPPVITLGADASESDVLVPLATLRRMGIDVVKTRRGGDVTYHGPGQLVAYPIFKLAGPFVRSWVGFLEETMIETLRRFGISAVRSKTVGVRVGGESGPKIGFVGIKISRGVSYHGISLNVNVDLTPFGYIVPCAHSGDAITSMEKVLGKAPVFEDVADELVRQFSRSMPAELSPPSINPEVAGPKPRWLRRPLPGGPNYSHVRGVVDAGRLHTVCESARCPNLGECWGNGTATFMILGGNCTRDCGFCAVGRGQPASPDMDEPARVAWAVRQMSLRHVVITSVTRDDLPDGGASVWAATVRAVRDAKPDASIEVLIPDFRGDVSALNTVLSARPDIVGHNLETVPRLYPAVRPQARYMRSLDILSEIARCGFPAKTGLMLGIGETPMEIFRVLREASSRGVNNVTLGQYLRPSPNHLPVRRWVDPSEFDHWARIGHRIGIAHVESAPLVRSSYHAEKAAPALFNMERR